MAEMRDQTLAHHPADDIHEVHAPISHLTGKIAPPAEPVRRKTASALSAAPELLPSPQETT